MHLLRIGSRPFRRSGKLDSYRHLLGEQLAREYEEHFVEMRSKGYINKLESIAVRGVEIIQAGSDGREDLITVLFTANLLDYTVDAYAQRQEGFDKFSWFIKDE
ncbi:MAG: Tim44 domain-containing protein [Proteobacteria bacterium]|nr:Tim44 domain-containing protein [Pseudomonadota bacterium]